MTPASNHGRQTVRSDLTVAAREGIGPTLPKVPQPSRRPIVDGQDADRYQAGPARLVRDDRRVTVDGLETACPGCRILLPVVEAPAHPYMACSPACWVRYGDLLAVQYTNPRRMAFHPAAVTSAFLASGWLERSAGRGLRVTAGYDQKLDRWLTAI